MVGFVLCKGFVLDILGKSFFGAVLFWLLRNENIETTHESLQIRC